MELLWCAQIPFNNSDQENLQKYIGVLFLRVHHLQISISTKRISDTNMDSQRC